MELWYSGYDNSIMVGSGYGLILFVMIGLNYGWCVDFNNLKVMITIFVFIL